MRKLLVAVLALLAAVPASAAADDAVPAPFRGHGMWIWQVPRILGGDPDAIAEQARLAGVETLYVKGAQGATPWSQFNATFVGALQAHGLDVCAYQRMESTRPVAQARAAAAVATAAGADCFVIDGEAEVEGRYDVARRYVRALRKRLGPDFAVGFTSFPYVDYHPLLPYSVFLGEGAATVNLPQIYWKDIGHSPRTAYLRTVNANSVYDRPMAPIGQLYEAPRRREIRTFRRLADAHGAVGLSWWSWDSAVGSGWRAIAGEVPPLGLPAAAPVYPTVGNGARSDYVVWAEDHLRELGYAVGSDTRFDALTRRAVQAFQLDRGLPVTGVLDGPTWAALLAD